MKVDQIRTIIGAHIGISDFLWQPRLMDHGQFSRFCRDRSLGLTKAHIQQLWLNGFIRAMKVRSKTDLRLEGLELKGQDSFGRYIYADLRQGELNLSVEFEHSLKKLQDVQIYFHPYQFYVLRQFDRVLSLPFSFHYILLPAETIKEILSDDLARFIRGCEENRHTANLIERDLITGIAIIAQPIVLGRTHNFVTHPKGASSKDVERQLASYEEEILGHLAKIPFAKMEEYHREICISADMQDRNKDIHTLIRLMSAQQADKIVGSLGGAIHCLTIAETIRRITELIHKKEIPEEDERGFGVPAKN